MSNVSPNGFWLLLDEREVFVPFKDFPWFRNATIGQLTTVERPHMSHLYWPELDVDLAVDSLDHPERYPLVSQPRQGRQMRPLPQQSRARGQRLTASRLRG